MNQVFFWCLLLTLEHKCSWQYASPVKSDAEQLRQSNSVQSCINLPCTLVVIKTSHLHMCVHRIQCTFCLQQLPICESAARGAHALQAKVVKRLV